MCVGVVTEVGLSRVQVDGGAEVELDFDLMTMQML